MLILKNKLFFLFLALAATLLAGFAVTAQQHGQGGHHHGGGGHDEVNMPGLQGVDTTVAEVDDMKKMFREHKGIRRSVVNLTNGIETITESDDPALRSAVAAHVVGMIGRVQAGRDPKVVIQSPTLDTVFDGRDRIETTITMTATGVRVTQTSADPAVVKALQTHAGEVSEMAERGMAVVHERMAAMPDRIRH
jgi:hypothetical protein